jgi:hypothetical protein
MAAVGTGLDVTAKGRSAALLDRRHDPELVQAQVPGMRGPVGWPSRAKDVGDLDRRHRRQPSGSAPLLVSASRSSGLITARIVLVAT